MKEHETPLTDDESEEVAAAADEVGVSIGSWLRGAAIIRLFTENDEEYLADAVEERGDSDEL